MKLGSIISRVITRVRARVTSRVTDLVFFISVRLRNATF